MSYRIYSWVRVVVEIDGEDHTLGQARWSHERSEDPQSYAAGLLSAWDRAQDQADTTLRLYGAEGVARALAEGATSHSESS